MEKPSAPLCFSFLPPPPGITMVDGSSLHPSPSLPSLWAPTLTAILGRRRAEVSAGLCENGFLPAPPLPQRAGLSGVLFGNLGCFHGRFSCQRTEKEHPKISEKRAVLDLDFLILCEKYVRNSEEEENVPFVGRK